ncbi:MAG TPA: response regulator, partial [Desulfobulbaceae bacterium]|nr:response regulator [Desulfobulbaceae bacterium]
IGTTFSFTIALPACARDKVQQVCQLDGDRHSNVTGLRVLLVEDNEANRELGTILLESSGQKVQVAEHGLRALELLSDDGFDVVLMDVQMPEMDGVTATRVIRAVEEGREPETLLTGELFEKLKQRLGGGHVPIIALTAHAMDSDRTRCLDAGMDEYLTKPFQPEQVVEVLQKFGGKETLADSRPASAEPVSPAADESEMEKNLGCRVRLHLSTTYKLQPEQVDQLLVTSARSLSEHLDKALAALKAEESDLLREAAHGLKGNLLNLGLQEHAQTAAMVEQRAGAGEVHSCRRLLVSLQSALAGLLGQGRR